MTLWTAGSCMTTSWDRAHQRLPWWLPLLMTSLHSTFSLGVALQLCCFVLYHRMLIRAYLMRIRSGTFVLHISYITLLTLTRYGQAKQPLCMGSLTRYGQAKQRLCMGSYANRNSQCHVMFALLFCYIKTRKGKPCDPDFYDNCKFLQGSYTLRVILYHNVIYHV
jgi:hypothetical protein